MKLIAIKRKRAAVFKLKLQEITYSLSVVLSAVLAVLVIGLLVSYVTTPRISILGFHGIVDLDNPTAGINQTPTAQRMAYPKQSLEDVLEYLVRENYWFLSTQDLYDFFIDRSLPIPLEHMGQKPVMVSFDDSYKTVYTNVMPILEKLEQHYGRKAKVVLFVNPGTLVKSDRLSTTYLSCDNLRDGFSKGFYDIQSHGQTHKNLVTLNTANLDAELSQAQIQLRSCLSGLAPASHIASHIAYPYGATNHLVEARAAKYYQSGYLYNSRLLRFRWLNDRYAIPRLTVNRTKSAKRVMYLAARSSVIAKPASLAHSLKSS